MYTYDSRSRVTQIALKNSFNTALRTSSYTFDSANNVLTRTDDSVVTTFSYDVINQLLSETRTGYTASYTYDANGNRVTKTLNGATDTYTSDAGDKLTAVTGANPKTFAYDACGRTTSITAGGVSTNFSYDYEDRVTQITRSGMTTNTFGYNGVGTRVSKTDSAGSAAFMRNGVGVTAPVLSDGAATYTPGVGERRGSTTKHYGADLKNEVAQISTMQTISASKQYDAFGNVTSSSGTFNGPFSYGGKFGYQTDSDTSYQLLGHRYYDSSTGRFLTRDVAKDGGNWYAYCGNNPGTSADPKGLSISLIGIIISEGDVAALPPLFPPGERVDRNIGRIREAIEFDVESSAATGYPCTSAIGLWVDGVRPGGSWDYKLRDPDPEKFDDAGNFNYGATGAALGIPLELLLGVGDGLSYVMYARCPDDEDDRYWTERGYRYYRHYHENR